LGDIADIVGGGTPSTGNQSYWDGDIDWYAPAEIADQIYANSSQKKITGLGYENSSAKMLPPGTVLFTSRAGIGKTAILTRKGCTNQGFQSIVPHRGELDSYFIFSRTEELKRYGELVGAGSTFVEVSGKQMAVMELMMPPTMREQQTIGGFFQQLDNLITLHQRQSFSHSTPDISLSVQLIHPFYTSSWEQRKLSEMCGTFEYGLNAAAKEFDGNNKYIRITDIDDASREFLLSDLSSPDICLDGMSKYLLSSGDIVFARTGASVGKTYIYRENDGIVYFAGFLIRAKVNQDNDAEFVFQSTLSPSYEKYIRITSQRSGQPGVNAQEYGEYDLFAPSKEEQQRIGHFLRGIDNLITLHQRKGKAAVSGCSNDANNSKGVCCKARDFGYKCHKKDESK
jgi:type I restriction enzyme S subunit